MKFLLLSDISDSYFTNTHTHTQSFVSHAMPCLDCPSEITPSEETFSSLSDSDYSSLSPITFELFVLIFNKKVLKASKSTLSPKGVSQSILTWIGVALSNKRNGNSQSRTF